MGDRKLIPDAGSDQGTYAHWVQGHEGVGLELLGVYERAANVVDFVDDQAEKCMNMQYDGVPDEFG
jgi:hypothetical protein